MDAKESVNNGAELITPIQYITTETASKGLNAMHDACMQLCCDSGTCDTALLSMKVGLDGYRCYLFKCNQKCFFLKHNDYVVLRMRTSEQLNDPERQETKKTTKVALSTKPYKNDNFNSEMMVGSMARPDNNPDLTSNLGDKKQIYFTEKSFAVTSSSNIMLAVFLLVLGISLVIMLFCYLILSTKYFNKRISRLRNNAEKNVDVDGDYLINGMYL